MRNLIKFYILVLLIASGNCAYNTRQRSRQNAAADRDRGGRANRGRTCSSPKLVNGFSVPMFKGKMIRFDCNKGYYRLGERYAECSNGRWSIYNFPICIKNGCSAVSTVDNGKITYLNRNATVMLFCEPNYEIVGSSYAHCNGTNWDRTIGTCKETDNTPSTSCDFEGESICGWMHDTDHDLDFERRSGYNNKTISILTGPPSDHTIKLPFQGHYMVINTNTEVYTKKARLISPLYKVNATKLCFQLYYHMYGISVGTLRVYVKPESMELQDILIEDMEAEAKNEYLIFEIKGTQGNTWHKGSGTVKRFNESFQIIIEATSGQTRLSDIAIDDVSLLTDDDCDIDDDEDSDVDTKEMDLKEDNDDNSDSIFSIDSCVNRCFEDSNSSNVRLNANKTLTCSCSRNCDLKATCCPDFLDVCGRDDSSLGETTPEILNNMTQTHTTLKTTSGIVISTTAKAITMTSSNITYASTATPSTTSSSTLITIPTTKQTKRFSTTTTSSASSTIIIIQNKNESNENQQSSEKSASSDLVEIEDEHDIFEDNEDVYEPGNITNEKFMMQTERDEKLSFIFKTLFITVSSAFLAFIAIMIVYKQYKKSTNPLNYKERNESGSKRADEEFSEIRYLTSDEALDFTLASPENISDL
ncbi:hypothetical protein PVAND_007699 [Polypedilum vanderplanki]|uniref:Uncharacterized protein n=1 Tax=Polypedilum vanderplanki TaxID=319348 RepID=A0A9J6C875_POLVA|nr:hypothetical protein PVAND_007699 [Polypedilum vanderplanki]